MKAKGMEKILAFDCKYAEGAEKRTHKRLYKTPVSRLHLQSSSNHGIRDGEASIDV
jgi:hypothetical protein